MTINEIIESLRPVKPMSRWTLYSRTFGRRVARTFCRDVSPPTTNTKPGPPCGALTMNMAQLSIVTWEKSPVLLWHPTGARLLGDEGNEVPMLAKLLDELLGERSGGYRANDEDRVRNRVEPLLNTFQRVQEARDLLP